MNGGRSEAETNHERLCTLGKQIEGFGGKGGVGLGDPGGGFYVGHTLCGALGVVYRQ